MVQTVNVDVPLNLIKRIKSKVDLCDSCPPDKKLICYLNKGANCEEYRIRQGIRRRLKESKFVAIPMVCWDCRFQKNCFIFRHHRFEECAIARVR